MRTATSAAPKAARREFSPAIAVEIAGSSPPVPLSSAILSGVPSTSALGLGVDDSAVAEPDDPARSRKPCGDDLASANACGRRASLMLNACRWKLGPSARARSKARPAIRGRRRGPRRSRPNMQALDHGQALSRRRSSNVSDTSASTRRTDHWKLRSHGLLRRRRHQVTSTARGARASLPRALEELGEPSGSPRHSTILAAEIEEWPGTGEAASTPSRQIGQRPGQMGRTSATATIGAFSAGMPSASTDATTRDTRNLTRISSGLPESYVVTQALWRTATPTARHRRRIEPRPRRLRGRRCRTRGDDYPDLESGAHLPGRRPWGRVRRF